MRSTAKQVETTSSEMNVLKLALSIGNLNGATKLAITTVSPITKS
jgi:hypothetical protein